MRASVWGFVAVALLCLAAIGCGGLPEVPSRGGPRWLSLTSEHFVLLTDAPDARARELSGNLERQLHALCELGFRCTGALHLQLRVIALADRAQFEHYFGPDYAGIMRPELLFEPLLVLSTGTSSDSLITLNRTLSVALAAQALGPLPPWLFKGLGAYFESAHYDADGAFVVGAVPPSYAAWLHRQPRVPAAQLLDPQQPIGDDAATPSAWLLVHYLMSERGSDFAAFQSALASGRPLSDAFKEAFPDLSPERLDGLLDHYAASGNYLSFSKRISPIQTEPQVTALRDADVYALRAELGTIGRVEASEVDESLKLALAGDPQHVRAAMLSAARHAGATDLPRARELVHAHPDDGLAQLHLAVLLDHAQSPERCAPELTAKLESLMPHNPYAVSLRGLCELAQGHADSALRLSRRALALGPNNASIAQVHAKLLRALHACSELASLEERLPAAAREPCEAR